MLNKQTTRTGRRPGPPATREAILAAAREAFTGSGYRAATIRAIAANAGVDPSLVMHFFGSKEALFVEAVRPPVDISEVVAGALHADLESAGATIVSFLLEVWESDAHHRALLALVRAAVNEEAAAAMFRRAILGGVTTAFEGYGLDEPGRRAALVVSQLIGLAISRYVVALEPVAAAPRPWVAAAIAPTIQRYISGPLPAEEER